MSLFFNTLSRFVIALLPRSNCLLISQLQLPSTVILETKKRKFVPYFLFSPSVFHEVMGLDAMILGVFFVVVVVVLIFSFKPAIPLSSFTFIKRLFNSSSLFDIRVVSSSYLRLLGVSLGYVNSSL